MIGYHVVDLPGGQQAEVPDTALSYEIPDGDVTLHRNKAASRTLEYWKTKAVFCALRDILADEVQELENALWDILPSKDLDRAFGQSLDLIGRIVGEARDGRNDPAYRVRLRARERINRSQGRTNDIRAMLALLDPSPVTITDTPPAAFVVSLGTAPTGFATATELASLIAECRAAGVGALAVIPTNANGFFLGDATGSLATAQIGDATGSIATAPLADGRAA